MKNDKIFEDLMLIQKGMLKILGEVGCQGTNPIPMNQQVEDFWEPYCDVYETNTDFIIVMELSGVDKEEIQVSLNSEYISIHGVRKCIFAEKDIFYHNMEIKSGKFLRRIYYPEIPLNKDNPVVTYTDGFLKIVFPLKELHERIIEVK